MSLYSEIPNNELELFKLISSEFKTVFDVGCRDDLDLYHINPDCEYHLFEPFSDAIISIKGKMSGLINNNITLNEFGLSDEAKDNCVYYSNTQSFIPHWYVPPIDSGHRFSLEKLDDYVIDKKINKIDFLKIDVEGLDYHVILGGLETIKTNNIVSYIQIEYNGGIKQYVDLLDNFEFYLMVEPKLLNTITLNNDINVDFNQSLVKLDNIIIKFIDETISPTGCGGNIFGVNKNIELDKNIILKVSK
tara:strand:+ start:17898 stop:18638 length:741 start_codon:yes stop_codon:yes gene_type:complete